MDMLMLLWLNTMVLDKFKLWIPKPYYSLFKIKCLNF